MTKTYSCIHQGVNCYIIKVEIDISNGLPDLCIIGLPDNYGREAESRVKLAVKNSGYEIPVRKIVVNLAPADIKKAGTATDLSIAIGLIEAMGKLKAGTVEKYIFLGEVSLGGEVNGVAGMSAMLEYSLKNTKMNIIVPSESRVECSMLACSRLYFVNSIAETISILESGVKTEYQESYKSINNTACEKVPDFSEVIGQEKAKLALEIAAAGGHHCLMIGSAGCGKTMLASRLPSILPDMSKEEIFEVTKIYGLKGLLQSGEQQITQRPFRAPHHTITAVGMSGGGKFPLPGEISLAHCGVLFLDELSEFNSEALEVLRQPLESGVISIVRNGYAVEFPAKPLLIAATNPCKCGKMLEDPHACTCTSAVKNRYRNRLSKPLLDRIDIHVEMRRQPVDVIMPDGNSGESESSVKIKDRVLAARKIQARRFAGSTIRLNGEMDVSEVRKYCRTDAATFDILKKGIEKFAVSNRSYFKILKIARTAADLDCQTNIGSKHVMLALQFRGLDREFI